MTQPMNFMRHLVRQIQARQELGDVLLFAVSVLVVLPLLPDRTIDPFGVLNPRRLWLLVIWVMTINAVGYLALRRFGARHGLILAGLLGGFVSSAATIAGMGQRARSDPTLLRACVAAGLLSNVATVIQLALILVVVAPSLLLRLAAALVATGAAALAVGAVALRQARGMQAASDGGNQAHPFAPLQALLFATIVACALLAAAALHAWIGAGGTYAAAAATGFADVHAAAAALGTMTVASTIPLDQAALALGIAFTANSILKILGAGVGGFAYLREIAIGIAVINAVLIAALLV